MLNYKRLISMQNNLEIEEKKNCFQFLINKCKFIYHKSAIIYYTFKLVSKMLCNICKLFKGGLEIKQQQIDKLQDSLEKYKHYECYSKIHNMIQQLQNDFNNLQEIKLGMNLIINRYKINDDDTITINYNYNDIIIEDLVNQEQDPCFSIKLYSVIYLSMEAISKLKQSTKTDYKKIEEMIKKLKNNRRIRSI